MPGAIIGYREDCDEPHAHVTLANGDQVIVILDKSGVTISQSGPRDRILFRAAPQIAAKLCASLVDPRSHAAPSALRVFSAILLQLNDADSVEKAFCAAAAAV